MNQSQDNLVQIFDTTLRDGRQAGHDMPFETKIAIARKLDELGVDVIEAGFPISSKGDEDAVRQIAHEVRRPVICALARTKEEDIKTAWRAIAQATRPRIHVFVATSDIHVEKKLRATRYDIFKMAVGAVKQARSYCNDVEFSPEDAGRTSPEYLAEIVAGVIDAGATTINIPDTVGYQTPWGFEKLIAYVYQMVPELRNVTLSVHCHNDLGLAVANTLAGVRAGARQVEGCLLGIGERAGNAALEAIIMALETRRDFFGVTTNIATEKIGPVCRFISETIGYPIDIHKPVVGTYAFGHSSGIHRDGVNKDRRTYEIMMPESVGWIGTEMELVSDMGRSGIRKRLCEIGYDGDALVDAIYPRFTDLADRKGKLSNEDLHMLAQEHFIREIIAREKLFNINTKTIQYAPGIGSVHISRNGRVIQRGGIGDGPVAALFNAINDAVTAHGENIKNMELVDYAVVKGQGGPEAIAWVIVRVRLGNKEGYGRSGHPDTVKASAQAYIYAVNHMLQVPVHVEDL